MCNYTYAAYLLFLQLTNSLLSKFCKFYDPKNREHFFHCLFNNEICIGGTNLKGISISYPKVGGSDGPPSIIEVALLDRNGNICYIPFLGYDDVKIFLTKNDLIDEIVRILKFDSANRILDDGNEKFYEVGCKYVQKMIRDYNEKMKLFFSLEKYLRDSFILKFTGHSTECHLHTPINIGSDNVCYVAIGVQFMHDVPKPIVQIVLFGKHNSNDYVVYHDSSEFFSGKMFYDVDLSNPKILIDELVKFSQFNQN